MKNLIAVLSLSLLSLPSQAKLFTNSYISFELPPRWDCTLDKTEWICRSETGSPKEAVIILTAKEVGPGDSLQQYESYLKSPKTVADTAGKPTLSQIKQTKQIQIAGQIWVDGMHLGSEVPFYYTRYLATIKARIAILVTFSAHQRYYTKYSNDFFKAIQSLRVIATPNLLNASGASGGGMIGAPLGVPQEVGGNELPAEPTGSSSSKKNALLMAVLLAAIGGYVVLKKKKKKPQGKNPF